MTTQEFTNILFNHYPIRRSSQQKEAFIYFAARAFSTSTPALLDHHTRFGFSCTNIIFGDPAKADAIIAAYYDTPAMRFFPYRLYYNNPLAQYLQTLIPMILIFFICSIFTLLFHWKLFFACLLFLPFALCIKGIFFNSNNYNYSSGLIALHALCQKYQKDNLCIVLLDNSSFFPSGKLFFKKKYSNILRNKEFFLLHLLGQGNSTLIKAEKKYKALFDNLECYHIVQKRNKYKEIDIFMAEYSPLGYHSGPIATSKDQHLNSTVLQKAILFTSTLLNRKLRRN